MRRLTNKQEEILSAIETGHNAFITGQAGTGKTFLVKEIYSRLVSKSKNVTIVCSSGIASTVYSDLHTSIPTVYTFYGLKTADLPWKQLVNRSVQDNLLRERVAKLDCLIWDEASMSSRRMIELVNRIHLELTPSRQSYNPFNGIQVVIVGEFLQLRPVPNIFDEGHFMFKSPIFACAITHRYELKTVMRQDVGEEEFVRCLKQVRVGKCDAATATFIKSMARELPEELRDVATHIFFKKIPTQMFNLNCLRRLPGPEIRIDAIDNGDTHAISCPAESCLVLKPGCWVMLVWNKNERLRNGTGGTFLRQEGTNHVIVEFPNVGDVKLKREVWCKRGSSGDVVGSRTQFPLILMYPTTCHKSQGLTLQAAVVHCTKEFVPGLIYVAMTRVRRSAHLQMIDFHSRQLVPPNKECVDVCDGQLDELADDFSCCRKSELVTEELSVQDSRYEEDQEECDREYLTAVDANIARVVKSYFERGDPNELYIDLETVHAVLCDENCNRFLRTPPTTFKVREILDGMKIEEPLTDYAESKNTVIDDLLVSNVNIDIIGNIMWSRACQIVIEESIMSASDVFVSSKQWSINTRELHRLVTKSSVYRSDLKALFETEELSSVHSAIGSELMFEVYKEVVAAIANKVREEISSSPVQFRVKDMPNIALSKLRYVGAWAVAKVLHKKLNYVRSNMASNSGKTLSIVSENLEMCHLLEEYAKANIEVLQQDSKYPATLNVTEDKQWRSRGLTHIEDCIYEFFLDVEQMRVDLLNEEKLKVHKENLFNVALETVSKSNVLKDKWRCCFPDDANKGAINSLFLVVVKKFMKAGAGQYMRDFRLAHRIKKSAEHRKKVLEKKAALEVKKSSVDFNDILADKSDGKVTSHHLLLNYLNKHGEAAFVKVYTKVQLLKMCNAYGVPCRKRSNKAKLVQDLIPAMKNSVHMVYSYLVDNLQSQTIVDSVNQHVSLRIVRQT